MSTLQVRLDERAWRQLQQLAQQRHCSPDELARDVLLQWLQIDEQDWQARMERLIQAFRRRTQGIDPDEIEAEITAAYEEYRSECAP
ncbi:MAG: hypothetical protein NZL85_06280 [Fimbriimonadales bacterium]|nr:hypothetical protein [Fimbriimonadales bacterium]